MTKKISLVLASIWWGWTALIDFAVVPTVFKIINDFFNAGELGIALFTRLNFLEVILSSCLIVALVLNFKEQRRGKIQLALACSAWLIVMFYLAYLTPRITELTALWKEAEMVNKMGIAGINDIQQEHQFYHRVYVGLDSLKLLILSFIIGLNVFRKETPLAQA